VCEHFEAVLGVVLDFMEVWCNENDSGVPILGGQTTD